MGKSLEIKKRIKAVASTRRITKTMQMIATSKFSRAQQRAVGTKPYTEALFGLVGQLATGDAEHPILVRQTTGEDLTLILTSNRGLCGPYNGSILRTALRHLREKESRGELDLVGKKGVNFLKFNGMPITRALEFGDEPRYEEVERLASEYIDRYIAGQIKSVRVIYMRYHSAGRQAPEILQLLPFEPGEHVDADATVPQYEYSPDKAQLLNDLLPAAIKAVLFQAFNDAIVSEHVARMVAMKAATDNAGKMGKALTRQFNRARQAQITTELTEIVSGAAALD